MAEGLLFRPGIYMADEMTYGDNRSSFACSPGISIREPAGHGISGIRASLAAGKRDTSAGQQGKRSTVSVEELMFALNGTCFAIRSVETELMVPSGRIRMRETQGPRIR